MIDYLSEIETEFENTLACLSRAQIGSNHDKMEVKISWHTPFNATLILRAGLPTIFYAVTSENMTSYLAHQGLKEFFLWFSWKVHQLFLRAPGVQIRWNFWDTVSLLLTTNFWILGFFNSVHLFDDICFEIFLTLLEIWIFQF